jgi:hypothetical protein
MVMDLLEYWEGVSAILKRKARAPVAFKKLWPRVFNFGTNSATACLAPWTPYEQVLVSLLTPLLLLMELLCLSLLHLALHHYMNEHSVAVVIVQGENASLWQRVQLMVWRLVEKFSWDKYIGGAMSILLFSYTQVTVTAVQYLYCVQVGSELRLFVFPTVNCRSSTYRAYLGPVITALVAFVFGFPSATFLWLWRRHAPLGLASSIIEFSVSNMIYSCNFLSFVAFLLP